MLLLRKNEYFQLFPTFRSLHFRDGIGSGHTETICTKVYSTKILLFPHAFDNRLAYSFIFLKIVDLGKE